MLVSPLLLLALASLIQARLVIYPSPGSGATVSDKFHVHLTQQDVSGESFVHMVTSDDRAKTDKHTPANRSVSWTSFAFQSSHVTVRVTAFQDFRSCLVRPRSYGILCQRTGLAQAEFVFKKNTQMVSVEFDNSVYEGEVQHKLMVFADPLETDVPDPHDQHVLYYGPGVHKLLGKLSIPDDVTQVYLAPGAVVHGGLYVAGNNHTKIRGRGVLTGTGFRHKEFDGGMLDVGNGDHNVVEGIVVADPIIRYVRMQGHSANVTLNNVKFLGAWTATTGGVSFGEGGVVTDCFFNSDDDIMMINANHIRSQRNVFWQGKNGACFQFGWTQHHGNYDVLMEDIDVIHTDWCMYKRQCTYMGKNDAVFDLAASEVLSMHNYTFRNIRLEGTVPRLFKFEMKTTGSGFVRDMLFENIHIDAVATTPELLSKISGTPHSDLSNWRFVNVTVGDHCVTNPDQLHLAIDSNTTKNFQFVCPNSNVHPVG